jgi:hypothetical protein
LNLPYRTHTWLLGPLLGTRHISHQLKCRFLKFFQSMGTCNNRVVNMLHRLSILVILYWVPILPLCVMNSKSMCTLSCHWISHKCTVFMMQN